MPVIDPASAIPQYNAGTDGRLTVGAAAADGSLSGVRTAVAEIKKWTFQSSLEGRGSTVTAESSSDAGTGVVHKTHLRHGGIATTKISMDVLLLLNTGKFTSNTFRVGTEMNAAFIIDKTSTIGYYDCLITILGYTATGLNVEGQPTGSVEAELNGILPPLSAGP